MRIWALHEIFSQLFVPAGYYDDDDDDDDDHHHELTCANACRYQLHQAGLRTMTGPTRHVFLFWLHQFHRHLMDMDPTFKVFAQVGPGTHVAPGGARLVPRPWLGLFKGHISADFSRRRAWGKLSQHRFHIPRLFSTLRSRIAKIQPVYDPHCLQSSSLQDSMGALAWGRK
jgi:hypothetical protein